MTFLSQRQFLFLSSTTLLFLVASPAYAETVTLARCPKEPDVMGEFYNNGQQCIRDRKVIAREIQDGICPDGYTYKNGYCRKRLHTKVRPQCPNGWQLYGGKNGQCHSPCPDGYSRNYGECVMKRTTLPPRFMTCDEFDAEGRVQQRVGAMCCSHELGNCPKTECKVEQAPGKFYYQDDGRCQRQAQSLTRKTSPQNKIRLGDPNQSPPGVRPRRCPEKMMPIRNVCQEPCPEGYRASAGACQLFECTFDAKVDTEVRCPEGIYKLSQSMV